MRGRDVLRTGGRLDEAVGTDAPDGYRALERRLPTDLARESQQ